MYAGVHENMCIMGRSFAIETVRSWGWPKMRVAVARELVDVMYTPADSPYVSHADGLAIHTEYIEKFWAASVSMYDVLAELTRVSMGAWRSYHAELARFRHHEAGIKLEVK